ncbi:MAG TPA: class I SAM-dependent methyltransferase [Aggregatilineales bacterium]|nr:class I SAM-dependent methyltransferase [Anaerolineales bacterium]HRE46450.1 class I SAM-dependent methyltransferase [Aggregatilineales bacterium]
MTHASDPRTLSQERFGALAANYVGSPVHSMGYTLDRLLEGVQPAPGKHALDIATGGGHVALGMAKAGAAVIAADLTLPMLHAAQGNLAQAGVSADYLNLDAVRLPFSPAAVDVVTCRFAAHHFTDVPGFVRECARITKAGGVIGIVDQIGPADPLPANYCNAFETLRDPSHAWQYSQPEWESFLRGVGYTVTLSEVIGVVFDLGWWTQMQNNDPDTVIRLKVMLRQAPPEVAAWHAPEFDPADETNPIRFTHRHMVLIGVLGGKISQVI